ncbi:MAG: lasso peptide biosynthesis B2 protein [Candidatus Acidiferrales bacterium]
MWLAVLRAYTNLMVFDLYLARGNFQALYNRVRKYPLRSGHPRPQEIELICHAVDLASICYWKQVRCLQHSAATACLLKRQGIAARMVIGAQQVPFRAHAWVEVDGCVVNDKPYMREIYGVLDQC